MIKTQEQRAKEMFDLLNERTSTYFLTDDEIKFVHWLAQVNDEKWHNVFVGLLNKIPGKKEHKD